MIDKDDINPDQAIPLLKEKIKNMEMAVTDAAIDLDVTQGNPHASPEEIAVLDKRLAARKWQRDELQRRLTAVEEALHPKKKED